MSNYKQVNNASQQSHFSKALFGKVEKSRMTVPPVTLTSFNAGDIVPIRCTEILPETDRAETVDFVIRQTTLKTPTMGQMVVDIYAFWVPNRIVNQSWKAVEGENYSGSWTAPKVTLAPLKANGLGTTTIPVGSVADYYGLPTQAPLPNSVLALSHDLKFRGYVMIYNEHFRDQNYQPPIAMSTLNVYQGFLDADSAPVHMNGGSSPLSLTSSTVPDGSYAAGAVANELFGSGHGTDASAISAASPEGRFRALHKPFKANKYHDYFTSVLPSPQKSLQDVLIPAQGSVGSIPVIPSNNPVISGVRPAVRAFLTTGANPNNALPLMTSNSNPPVLTVGGTASTGMSTQGIYFNNLVTDSSFNITSLGIDISDLRMASAIQQVYETLARGGSRYRSILSSFFGAEYDEAFCDVPVCLGHITRDLELYQTAQTSESSSGGTPQGNLAAFGYTSSRGFLYKHHFVEHGYVHIFAVVRHRNLYSSFMSKDWFRTSMLDYYYPQLANISEQPVFTREINPFASAPNDVFGYQEAWSEYRYEPDIATGLMRSASEGAESLNVWNYADDFDPTLQIATGDWLKSNSEEILNRTLALTSDNVPQFKAQFVFHVDKTLPMPTYSVPGMDII
ncbi:major capsid protein [Dipodfec virus UOA04_Rod_618]|nr:major capsid protein [Dipodfec virus UOA04_Rod_618]